MNKALTTGTMNTEVMLLPDFSAPKIEAEKMSPMDSLKAIFEDMRDSLSTLVEQTKDLGPSASDLRDQNIGDADVGQGDTGPVDDGGGGGSPLEMPEVGPKLGLALMLAGLTVLFSYGDEIAKAIEPVLEAAKKVVDKLGIKGTLYAGLALVAGIKFGGPLLKLLGKGAGTIKGAFGLLKTGFTTMKDAVMSMPGLMKSGYMKGKELLGGAIGKLKGGFNSLKGFILIK